MRLLASSQKSRFLCLARLIPVLMLNSFSLILSGCGVGGNSSGGSGCGGNGFGSTPVASDTINAMGTLPGDMESFATVINAGGQIIGTSDTASGVSHTLLFHIGSTTPTDLGTFADGLYSSAKGINASGKIVGFSERSGPDHAFALQWGVNVHDGGGDPQTMARRLAERNLRTVRMDLWGNDPAYLARFRRAASRFRAKAIRIQAVVFTDFSPGGQRNQDVTADPGEVERAAYTQTRSQVDATKDLVGDYEMANEITLGTPHILADGATGQRAADFDTPAGRLQAAVLRGMSKAIRDAGAASGHPLRVILGTVNRHWGFLAFMQQQGVVFDVVGYHIYPWEKNPPLDRDPWFGSGGPLGQIARFGKPITINEFNAGEIYSGTAGNPGPDYGNRVGDSLTEAGFRSEDKHLREIVHQTAAHVESVLFYEVADEPRKAPPENRFGLYADAALRVPKISLLLAASYAGGALSEAEKRDLTARGIGAARQR